MMAVVAVAQSQSQLQSRSQSQSQSQASQLQSQAARRPPPAPPSGSTHVFLPPQHHRRRRRHHYYYGHYTLLLPPPATVRAPFVLAWASTSTSGGSRPKGETAPGFVLAQWPSGLALLQHGVSPPWLPGTALGQWQLCTSVPPRRVQDDVLREKVRRMHLLHAR